MPIKFINSSNKTKTHPKTTPQSQNKPHSGDPNKDGLTPHIDKLSVVIKPSSEEDAYGIDSNIWTQFEDKDVFQSAGKNALNGYNAVKLIALQSTLSRPLLQYRREGKKAEKFRLEFSPRKLGEKGLDELHAVLVSILPDGWSYVIENGKITRIDVMVDLPNARMDAFALLPKAGGLTVMEWAVNGTLESYRLGKPQGNQTVVYSVKKKRLNQGKPWPGQSVVRIERRLRNPKPDKLSSLPTLENPFASMILCENLPGPPPDEKGWRWTMFGDSVKVRGLVPALGLLPDDRRTKYRKHLEAYQQPWWDPEAIWARWPGMLAQLNIASAESWG